MIETPTFIFMARPKQKHQWDTVSKYGQTVKVILGEVPAQRIINSARLWNKRKWPAVELKVKVRAQTFVLFEVVQPKLDGI